MAFSSSSSSSTLSCTPNVTPLIDVLLVLLIIFMVIVPVAPRGLESLLPSPSTPSQASPEPPPLVLEVSAARGGHGVVYRLDGRVRDLPELQASLREGAARSVDPSLLIGGDPALDYGVVASVLGEAKDAGIQRIGLLPRHRK